ncbi:ExbD/TolR family protein [Nannocystis radixulma]|uniref:Biopolymer transporter ExbD n=1 Tax=Nannocystis radixulma TaxID=2995305 RepID=A0ABT5BH63_9BACT|nr:biopolymer transporter ExbD [Nannocystis radixulma]MDC0673453.1 biopolymer transporter ExbD [Nannocystis radixulma]
MPPSRLFAPLLLLPLACDEPQAEKARQAREQALDQRIDHLEAEVAALGLRVKHLEEERLRQLPSLPPASGGASNAVVVELTADTIRVGDETVDLARLEALLRERLARQPDVALTVSAARTVAYARVIEVLDLGQRVGIRKTSIADDPSKK